MQLPRPLERPAHDIQTLPAMSLEAPDFGTLSLTSPGDRFADRTTDRPTDYRLFRIEEISADKPSSHR